jgi:hypothetical protein
MNEQLARELQLDLIQSQNRNKRQTALEALWRLFARFLWLLRQITCIRSFCLFPGFALKVQ